MSSVSPQWATLRKAHNYLVKQSLEASVDWKAVTIGGVAACEARQYDFREPNGRAFRKQFASVDTSKLRRVLDHLSNVASIEAHHPEVFITWYNATIAPSLVASLALKAPSVPGLEQLPDALRRRLHCLAMGWWTRHTVEHKGIGYYLSHRWTNESDPITLDDVRTELPSRCMITYCDRADHRRVYVFDVRALETLFAPFWVTVYRKRKSRPGQLPRNPLNNQPFDEAFVRQVQRRLTHLKVRGTHGDGKCAVGPGGTTLPPTHAPTPPIVVPRTVQERVVNVCSEMDRLNYSTNVEWWMELTRAQLLRWYQRCEDVWVYRAQLTSEQQQAIAPGHQRVFAHRHQIRRASHTEAFHIVLDAMERLVSTGATDDDRVLGVMYTLTALTECSTPVREAYPYLFQPSEPPGVGHTGHDANGAQGPSATSEVNGNGNATLATFAANNAEVSALIAWANANEALFYDTGHAGATGPNPSGAGENGAGSGGSEGDSSATEGASEPDAVVITDAEDSL